MKTTVTFDIEDLRALEVAAQAIVYHPELPDLQKQIIEDRLRGIITQLQE